MTLFLNKIEPEHVVDKTNVPEILMKQESVLPKVLYGAIGPSVTVFKM